MPRRAMPCCRRAPAPCSSPTSSAIRSPRRRRWRGAADRGVRGILLQVLDPAEVAFPFRGRTIFESMGGGLRHETLHAGDLRARYLDRLAARRDRLESLSRRTGWLRLDHATEAAPAPMLLTLFSAVEGGR